MFKVGDIVMIKFQYQDGINERYKNKPSKIIRMDRDYALIEYMHNNAISSWKLEHLELDPKTINQQKIKEWLGYEV